MVVVGIVDERKRLVVLLVGEDGVGCEGGHGAVRLVRERI